MDRRFRELMALFAGASILLAWPLLARGLEPAIKCEVKKLKVAGRLDPIFGSTAAAVHWTSSTNFNDVENAWLVEFNQGSSQTASKFNCAWVRAVRRDPPVLTQD